MRPRVIGLSLFLGLLVGWAHADHDVIPPPCVPAAQAVTRAQGQVDVPVIPDTMSRAEQHAVIRAWKAQRQPVIDAAKAALATCLRDYHQPRP